MRYPTVREKLPSLTDERIDQFLNRLVFRSSLVRRVSHVFDLVRARQDEPYINLAAAAHADFLVSRDKDLLFLATDHSLVGKEFRQRFPTLRVLNPVAFLTVIEAGKLRNP
jgi:predicted nucleic acid-binding protein